MPKTEFELWDWVVEHNRHTTYARGLTSNYGYRAILDVDLVAICKSLRSRFEPPIRILDIGCGNGRALAQLSQHLANRSLDPRDFEFWGIGINRYDDMCIPDDRFMLGGLNSHDFQGAQFHLVFSVFAFQYLWHKLEGLERIHNELLVEGGKAFVHFPGYLVRLGESPEALSQDETEGNQRFAEFVEELEATNQICPMNYRTVPYFSDDDDCAILAEFGHVRFKKTRRAPISFGHMLQAFSLFKRGFSFGHMDNSKRTYVASHYGSVGKQPWELPRKSIDISLRTRANRSQPCKALPAAPPQKTHKEWRRPYRITTLSIPTGDEIVELDVALHEQPSETVILVCPGACEALEGRVVPYAAVAETVVEAQLGAVVRYNDPYDMQQNYADFLLEKTRRIIELTLSSASHFCSTDTPNLKIMAYSSSAGAAAALASEYPSIDTLLLIAPSCDVPRERIADSYRKFQGDVRVLVGDSDQIILPQQAFWFYEQAESAATREYVEVPNCGHQFSGLVNKAVFLNAALWAFGDIRPKEIPAASTEPSNAWA